MKMPLQKWQWCIVIFIISLFLGLLDWVSGFILNFFVFYFLPVSLSAWFIGSTGTVVFSIVCTMIWFGADFLNGNPYSSHFYAVWNSMVRLISFLLLGGAVFKLKNTLSVEQETVSQLQKSLAEVKVLKAFLPICSQCKKIRDEKGVWQHIEGYISKHADTKFSHGYCPECYKKALAEAGLLEE